MLPYKKTLHGASKVLHSNDSFYINAYHSKIKNYKLPLQKYGAHGIARGIYFWKQWLTGGIPFLSNYTYQMGLAFL
jgi:hypothetical protein